MTEERYELVFADEADKQLRKLDKPIRQRITRALVGLQSNPRPDGVKKLKGGDNEWRIRIGDWRVIFEIQDGRLVVLVLEVGHRSKVYKGN